MLLRKPLPPARYMSFVLLNLGCKRDAGEHRSLSQFDGPAGDVFGDTARFRRLCCLCGLQPVKQLGRRAPPPLILETHVCELLPALIAHDKAGVQFLDSPGRREVDSRRSGPTLRSCKSEAGKWSQIEFLPGTSSNPSWLVIDGNRRALIKIEPVAPIKNANKRPNRRQRDENRC
jgi:hypothetical protein